MVCFVEHAGHTELRILPSFSSIVQHAYHAKIFQVKVVQRANKYGFPGLCCADLIANPRVADSSTLLLSSVRRSQEVILAVDVERSVAAI